MGICFLSKIFSFLTNSPEYWAVNHKTTRFNNAYENWGAGRLKCGIQVMYHPDENMFIIRTGIVVRLGFFAF